MTLTIILNGSLKARLRVHDEVKKQNDKLQENYDKY